MARLPTMPTSTAMAPASTAALLSDLVESGLARFTQAEVITMFRAIFDFVLRKFGDGGRASWQGDDLESARSEREHVDFAMMALKALHEVMDKAPGCLVFAADEGTKGKAKAADESPEELCVWLVPRFLHVCAVLRSAPVPSPRQKERIDRRFDFVASLESSLERLLRIVLVASHKELKEGRIERRTDFAGLWRVLEEEIRAWLEQGPEQGPSGKPLPGAVRLFGVDRRTQVAATGIKSTAAVVAAALAAGSSFAQLDHRPFLMPLLSRSYARALLLSTLRIHVATLSDSPPHLVDSCASAIEALEAVWGFAWTDNAPAHPPGPSSAGASPSNEEPLHLRNRSAVVSIAIALLDSRPEALLPGARERVAALILDQADGLLSRRSPQESTPTAQNDPLFGLLAPAVIRVHRMVVDDADSPSALFASRLVATLVRRHVSVLSKVVAHRSPDGRKPGGLETVAFVLLSFSKRPTQPGRTTTSQPTQAGKRKRGTSGPTLHALNGAVDTPDPAVPSAEARTWQQNVDDLIRSMSADTAGASSLAAAVASESWKLAGLEASIGRRIVRFASGGPEEVAKEADQLAMLVCARAGTLSVNVDPNGTPTPTTRPMCTLCDDHHRALLPTDPVWIGARTLGTAPFDALRDSAKELFAPIGDKEPKEHVRRQLAILRLTTRILAHTRTVPGPEDQDGDVTGKDASALGKSILPLLGASRRVTRLAAGRALAMVFAAFSTQPTDAGQAALVNRIETSIKSGTPQVAETSIITAVECFGMTTDNAAASLVCTIVMQLGQSRAYVRSVARNEIASLARRRDLTVYKLLAPFLPVISEAIGPQLRSLPQLLPNLAEILGMNARTFLMTTAEHTLPPLVLLMRSDIIEDIAEALDSTLPAVLIEYAHAIFPYFFLLGPQKTELGLSNFSRLLNSQGGQMDTIEQLALNAEDGILYRIIVALGDEAKNKREAARQALTIAYRRAHPSRGSRATVTDAEMGKTLESRMLFVLTQVNERLQDMHGRTSTRDKVKNLRGVGQLMRLAGPSVSGFTPQIMATLQTSLRAAELRDAALEAWTAFIGASRFQDLGPFVSQITATFVHHWDDMTDAQRTATARILDGIVNNLSHFEARYQWHVADLSSLATPLLDKAREKLERSRASATTIDRLHYLVDRIENENDLVAAQALRELRSVLTSPSQAHLRTLLAGDTFDPIIGKLLRAILAAALRRGHDAAELVRGLAFDCLGRLGAVDPDRCELPAEEPAMVMAKNFTDLNESVAFAIHLVTDGLVGAFRSTNDTKHQHHLAYAIQQLLRFCGFTEGLLGTAPTSGKYAVPSRVRKRWESLPKSILNILSPLLGSRFTISVLNDRQVTLPVYENTSTFSTWISAWTLYLISQAQNPNAKTIFEAFVGVIRNSDAVLALKLLPHLALNIVIAGTDDQVNLIRREITAVLQDQVNRSSAFSPEGRQLTAQAIFSIMDHFSCWIRDRRKEDNPSHIQIKRVDSVMSGVNQDLMAEAALYCKAHARALLNFEQRVRTLGKTMPADRLQPYYEHLHEIYAAIDEPDGMEGISTKIGLPSILHQIREHESTGRWTSAQSCWEVELQRQPNDLRSHLGLLQCLRNLGHYDSLRTHILGVLQTHPDWEADLAPFSVETSLVSSDWPALKRAVQVGPTSSPEVVFGKVVDTLLSSPSESEVGAAMDEARMRLGNQILGAGQDTYQRVYDSIVYLHILHEVDTIDAVCSPRTNVPMTKTQLQRNLASRFDALSPTFRCREQVLRLRRAAFQLRSPHVSDVSGLWVETAKIARKAGHVQTAYSSVLQASELRAPMAFLQRAKLLKLEDQPHKAIAEVVNFRTTLRDSLAPGDEVGLQEWGKACLRLLRWMDEIDRYDYNTLVGDFKALIAQCPSWESPHYYLGRYLDTMSQRHSGRNGDKTKVYKCRLECLKQFVHALQHGTKYIFQTLPRLLTLYFESGEDAELLAMASKLRRKSGIEPRQFLHELNKDLRKHQYGEHFYAMDKQIAVAVANLPPFVWLTVLPQVVSRVMHKSLHVQEGVRRILARATQSYPDHALWAMVSAFQSSDKERGLRCGHAVDNAIASTQQTNPTLAEELKRKYADAKRLVPKLLELCNAPVADKVDRMSMSKAFPKLYGMTQVDLIVPIQSSLTASLPPRDVALNEHRPFPPNLPTFASWEDEIKIMPSLQKPRRIAVIGSDGQSYPFLCKPKDDLRKDARLMEFNSMINKLLRKDSESRRRNLFIRTYAVIVLNEECGLLEWVSNTVPLRNILVARYQARGVAAWGSSVKAAYDKIKAEPSNAGKIFAKEILPMYPGVFHEWFLNTFPEPNAWLRGRQLYGRTAAVMSMVGFVLGLGDRHGENILFDSMSGATVHVDFNCLFDKGRTFEIAEKVPFRLTHNLVDGLGVTGTEGVFRKACEVTMHILRLNKDSLRSVLETFIHDPLVDWLPPTKKKQSSAPTEEHVAKEAKRALDPIMRKLEGLQITLAPPDRFGGASSTENQVESLIKEATDAKNLGGMYVGWSPWL